MEYFVWFIMSFIIIYLFYFLTVVIQKKKYDKFKKSNQVLYFVKKYELDINKIDIKKFIKIISLTNSFIIALVFTTVMKINNNLLLFLVALLILLPIMIICYHFIGIYLQKEEKNEHKTNRREME